MQITELLKMKSEVYKAMGEPLRLVIMHLLYKKGELCVCEILKEVSAGAANLSKHLAVLRKANIVSMRKEGTKVFYTLNCTCLIESDTCLDSTLRKIAEKKYSTLVGGRK